MKDAALQFINFASADRNMTEFTKLFRYGPTVKTVINAMPPRRRQVAKATRAGRDGQRGEIEQMLGELLDARLPQEGVADVR